MDVRHPRQAVMSISPDDPEPMYRIGTVSRLTGIATVTLRMWERRYNVVDPGRSSGRNRLYSRDDIARLALIKRLVDAGHSISTVAGLTLVQLHERLEVQEKPRQLAALPVRVPTPVRVAVLGDALPARIARAGSELAGLAIVASQRERARFLADAPAQEPQVLVIEVPALGPETAAEVEQLRQACGARHVVIVYGFGRRATVAKLDTAHSTPLRAPVGMAELRIACRAGLGVAALPLPERQPVDLTPSPDGIPSRRYDTDTLERIAASTPTLACECPHHLVDLVAGLSAFEDYSAQCENRSPEDAALHHWLRATTAQARALMEEALTRVAEAEGLLR